MTAAASFGDLAGKTVVITGGTGVLGAVFAKAFADSGASVAVIGRDEVKADQVVAEISTTGGRALAVSADVLDRDSLKRAHETVSAAFGPCDILVNGAGGNRPQGTTSSEYLSLDATDSAADTDELSFFDLTDDAVRDVLDLNFLGTLSATQEFARDMVGRPGCSVINISSMNAYTPLTKIPAYSAAKAAVSNFTQWLAVHFSKAGIRVNAIAPGFFVTDQNRDLLFDGDEPSARTSKILASTPMGRFGRPEELIGTLLFLASEQTSSFVNGVVIPVDGAFSAYSGV